MSGFTERKLKRKLPDPLFLSIPETSHTLHVSVTAVRRLIKTKALHAVKIGSQWRIPATAVQQMCE